MVPVAETPGFWGRIKRRLGVPGGEAAEPAAVQADGESGPSAAEEPGAEAVPAEAEREEPLWWECPREGPTWDLWALWAGEEGQSPRLSLEGLTDLHGGPAPDGEVRRELARLARAVEDRSRQRLHALSPKPGKKPADGEEDQEPDEPARLPADYLVFLAQNGMAAWVLIYPPVGEAQGPALDGVMGALGKAGVTTGLDPGAISAFLKAPPLFRLSLFARGVPVQEGQDGRIEEHFPRKRSKELPVDETGQVDHRARSFVQGIEKGQVICDILPPQPGTDGVQVTGRPVKAAAVKAAKVPKGSNTELSPDGRQLLASMSGHLEYAGIGFQVKPFLEIRGDVDYSTGNIDFLGDVHVGGDVRENFHVRATGTITIEGLVEAATVEAKGDIVIAHGVLGDNRAFIKSGRTVRAKFIENGVVYAGECVYAEYIMSSQIYSDDSIRITTGRGAVIGGCLTAAHRVEANVIGNMSGRTTEIVLGRLPYLDEARRDNEAQIAALTEERAGLRKELLGLEEARAQSQEESARLAKVRLRLSVVDLHLDKLRRHTAELTGTEPDLAQCRLVGGTVYPTAQIVIGPVHRTLERKWIKLTAALDSEEQEIVFT